MKLIAANIYYMDFVSKDLKKKLNSKLKKLTGKKESPKPAHTMSIPGPSSASENWGNVKIPNNLVDTFKSIEVGVIQYAPLSHTHILIGKGTLTQKSLKKIQKSKDVASRDLIYDARNKLGEFLKPHFPGIISESGNKIIIANACTLICFNFKIKNVSEIENNILAQKSIEKIGISLRESTLLDHYGINKMGLISLSEIFPNFVTIFGQAHAVYDNFGYDFTSLVIMEFSDMANYSGFPEGLLGPRISRAMQLLSQLCWSRYRLSQIPSWKARIKKLSSSIVKIENVLKEQNIQELQISSEGKKGDFLVDYASIVDEYRYIDALLEYEGKLSKLPFWSENPLISTHFIPALKRGIFEQLGNEISINVQRMKDEYKVLNKQYDELTNYMRGAVDLGLTQANLKISSTNVKLQKILIFLTGAIVFLTIILALIASK